MLSKHDQESRVRAGPLRFQFEATLTGDIKFTTEKDEVGSRGDGGITYFPPSPPPLFFICFFILSRARERGFIFESHIDKDGPLLLLLLLLLFFTSSLVASCERFLRLRLSPVARRRS